MFERVVAYAVLTSDVRYSAHSYLFRDGKEVGPVPRLAICQALGKTTFTLCHCDDEWDVLGVSGDFESVGKAKARAERTYPGVSACWVDPRFSETDAQEHLEQEWGQDRCRFCGKLPHDVELLVVHDRGGPICGGCIDELHASIHDKLHG